MKTENKQLKDFKDLELKDDFMFSLIMGQERYCRPFLEIILGTKVEKLEYHESQTSIAHRPSSKGVRADVYVNDGTHTVYDLEMQIRVDRKELPKRTRYYQGMIDLRLLEKGAVYSALQKVYIIFVCMTDPFDYGLHRYTFENTCREVPGLLLDDGSIKVFLNANGTEDDVSGDLKNLLHYIATSEPKDDFTRALDDAVREVKMDEKYNLEYIKRQIKDRENQQIGAEQERKRSEKLLAEKDAIIESLKQELAALSR